MISRSPAESLAKELAKYQFYPVAAAKFLFPWGKSGSILQNYSGPCPCQDKILHVWEEEIQKRAFNGRDAVMPIRIGVSSGHGIGKSFGLGMINTIIHATRPMSQGTATANTSGQLQTKTWAAISSILKVSLVRDQFSITSERMYENSIGPDGKPKNYSKWFCQPQTCREENSEAFAGQHAATASSYYINDEASAIPDGIFTVEEGGMTDGEPMQFLFGNPTRNTGYFYEALFGSHRHKYRTISIDSRECPLTNKVLIKQWESEYGEDSDFFRVRVRGLPPHSGDSQFIELERVRAAQTREVVALPEEPLIMSADFAWGGSDENVFRFRKGLDARSIPPIRIPGSETRDHNVLVSRLASLLTMTHGKYGDRVARCFCDSSGIAAPVAMLLRQRGFDQVVPVNFSGHSPDRRYGNMRVWMYARLRDWLLNGAIGRDPGYDRLETDLTAIGYFSDEQGRLRLQSKDEIRDLTGKSTDDGDALALLFAEDVPIQQQRHSFNTSVNYGTRPREGAWMI